MPTKDMIGQRFGKWTVLERAGSYKHGSHYRLATWKVVCVCGTENIVLGTSLRRGISTQCRTCSYAERQRQVSIDQLFGNLKILSTEGYITLSSGTKVRRALVECVCGTKKEVQLFHVLYGRTTSCGCKKTMPRKTEAEKRQTILRHKQKTKEKIEKLKISGRCILCASRKSVRDCYYCVLCLKLCRMRYHDLKQAGRCTRCPQKAVKNRSRCKKHLELARQYERNKKHPSENGAT